MKSATGVRKFEDLLQKETLFGGTGPSGGVDPGGARADAALRREDQADQGLPRRAGRGGGDGSWRGSGRLRHHHCACSRAGLRVQIKSGELVPIIHDCHASRTRSCRAFRASTTSPRPMTTARCSTCCSAGACSAVRSRRHRVSLADRLTALRKAFLDAMNDKRFVADAAKAQLDIAPASGEAVASLVARLFSHSKDTVKRAADVVRN